MTELENYCKRYMHFYHLQIERQPSRFMEPGDGQKLDAGNLERRLMPPR